jgi:hypothetical protein
MGVRLNKPNGRGRNPWSVRYWLKGQEKHGGSYSTELAAAKAYDRLVMTHYGEFARLNPPELDVLGVIIVAKSAEKQGPFDFD